MTSLAIKKQILKEVKNYGLAGAVDDDALGCIMKFLQEQGSSDNLQALLQLCQRDRPSSGDISRSVVEACITQLNGRGGGVDLVAIINAFDVPKISYDPVGRKMFADSAPRTLFADAPAKHRLYLDRLQLITQRIRRHKYFQQNYQVLAGASDGPSAQLTDLQSLKGVEGQQRFVMGCVSRGEDGVKLVLEDATGSMPLDISQAQWPAGFFTENCVVIAQGALSYDGVFHAQQLGLPPVESREELAEASKRLNFFGGPSLSTDELAVLTSAEASGVHREDRIVVAANVWLDKKETLDRIGKLFAGFQEVAIVPPVFVFMGNFHSKAPAVAGRMSASQRAGGGGGVGGVDYQSLRQGFASLASLIEQFPRIKANSRFIFVPGPGDPSPSDVLPQPPLPAYFTQDILRVCPNAVFASNPCRIRYLSQQVVFFRYDILKRLRRRCLLPISGGEPSTPEAMWQHLSLTLLQQSHLCPLPLLHQPIYWQADHALSLYPLPHAVVVADMSPPAAHTHVGCTVFTPGSFMEGHFAAYVPGQQAVELSELPKDGDLPADDWEDEDMSLGEDPGAMMQDPKRGDAAMGRAVGEDGARGRQVGGDGAVGRGQTVVVDKGKGRPVRGGGDEQADVGMEGVEEDGEAVDGHAVMEAGPGEELVGVVVDEEDEEDVPFEPLDLDSPDDVDVDVDVDQRPGDDVGLEGGDGVEEGVALDEEVEEAMASDAGQDDDVSPGRARKHARVGQGERVGGSGDGGPGEGDDQGCGNDAWQEAGEREEDELVRRVRDLVGAQGGQEEGAAEGVQDGEGGVEAAADIRENKCGSDSDEGDSEGGDLAVREDLDDEGDEVY